MTKALALKKDIGCLRAHLPLNNATEAEDISSKNLLKHSINDWKRFERYPDDKNIIKHFAKIWKYVDDPKGTKDTQHTSQETLHNA